MSLEIKKCKAAVKKYYRANRRNFPWRKTHDPYKILVSEVMLQQTQTERVVPKFNAFIKTFPNVEALAKAPLREVLVRWQGLGYNRRAKHLHQAAKQIVKDFGGVVPKEERSLMTLHGVGPYIAGAVRAFAFNEPAIFIETNIRTTLTHHFFKEKERVSDAELFPLLDELIVGEDAREWYSALMDYGAHLKRSGVRINHRSLGYTKQSRFEGSDRQIRGKILKLLGKSPLTEKELLKKVSDDTLRAQTQINNLLLEGLVSKRRNTIRLG